jgi:GxxExxY protein
MQRQSDIEELIQRTFDVGMAIHQEIGPELIESVYERVLADRMQKQGAKIDRQQPVHVTIDGVQYPDAFRYDLLINDTLLLEIKSVDKLGPIHSKQVLTYIRLMNLPFGLLLNFGGEVFRQGMRRIVNDRFQE